MAPADQKTEKPENSEVPEVRIRRRSKHRSRRRARRELERKIRGPVQLIWSLILLPIKMLFLPARLIDVFYFRGLKTRRRRRRRHRTGSARRRARSWWKEATALPYRLVSTALHRRRRGELFYLIPALLAVGFVGYVSCQLSLHNQRIESRYNEGARRALLDGNLTLANTYFGRLFERSSLSDAQRLQWVAVLRSAGEMKRAELLLTDLAPRQSGGYSYAHTVRAIELAARIDVSRRHGDGELGQDLLDGAWVKSPDLKDIDDRVEALRNHLRFANEEDPRIHLAWAKYWFYCGNVENACQRLEQAKQSKTLFLEVVRAASDRMVAGQLSDVELNRLDRLTQETLDEARNEFGKQVNIDPLNHRARIQLAATLVNQSKFELAKQTLVNGLSFHADPALRRGLADVFVIEYKDAQSNETDSANRSMLELRVNQLKSAIAADPDYLLPYVCLAELLAAEDHGSIQLSKSFDQALAEDSLAIETFRWLITSDEPAAIDHLGLATLHWHRGETDRAERHLEQAWAIQADFAQVAHRFAVAYAFFSDQPDLTWARKLIDRSLRRSPSDPGVLLSHGRILLEQGEFELAVEQLLRAVSGAKLPEEVHDALEAGYLRMGNFELAAKHGQLAVAAKTRRLVGGPRGSK